MLIGLLDWSFRAAFAGLQEKIVQELSFSLGLGKSGPSKSIWSSAIRWLAASPSVQHNLRLQIEELKNQITTEEKKNLTLIESKLEKERALSKTHDALEIVHQIQHDIQGPLRSIAGLIEMGSMVEEDRRILTSLFHKVQGMVNRLAVEEQVANPSLEGVKDYIAEALVKEVVREKKIAVTGQPVEIEFEFDKTKLNIIQVDSLQFCRMMSNLLQNAIESLTGPGKITLSVRRLGPNLFIVISDTGRGIPKNQIDFLFSNGATFGKRGGKGKGLYHARSCLSRWSGDISLESELGVGTNIFVRIPVSPTKAHVVGEIPRDDERVNIVVDDDIEVFSTLQPKLGNKSLYFASAEEFESWQRDMALKDPMRYIIDFNLGSRQSGIDLIARLTEPRNAILITNEFNRSEVIAASSERGFQVFPKIFLPAV